MMRVNDLDTAFRGATSVTQTSRPVSRAVGERFSIDTTFVLFFLAVDFGQSAASFGLDSLLSLIALGMLLVVPYFLPSDAERPDLLSWLLGRSLIAIFATALGMMLRPTVGTLLPDVFRFVPMTLLIVAALLSCYLQLYAMIRFRLAR